MNILVEAHTNPEEAVSGYEDIDDIGRNICHYVFV